MTKYADFVRMMGKTRGFMWFSRQGGTPGSPPTGETWFHWLVLGVGLMVVIVDTATGDIKRIAKE